MDDFDDQDSSSHTTSHLSSRMTGRVEIVERVSGRRRWTVEQKLAILRDAFGCEGSVRSACERHEIGSGQLYTWRRLAMSGELTGTKRTALPSLEVARFVCTAIGKR
jgi:transposase